MRTRLARWIVSAALVAGVSLCGCVPAAAKECAVRSGAHTVALVELYTSEGCSSCPRADRWLSTAPTQGDTTARLVRLALHVDYWNHLGWKDPFSQARFSERQERFAGINRQRAVYTPQVLLHGRDFRRWASAGAFTAAVREINARAPGAQLALTLARERDGGMKVSGEAVVPDARARPDTGVYLAVYENNLGNAVNAGENSGKRLQHDFVVRELVGPLPLDARGRRQFRLNVHARPDWKAADLGVAAFVQNATSGDVLQALAAPACL